MFDKKIKVIFNQCFKNHFDLIHQQIDYEQYSKDQSVKKRIWIKTSIFTFAICSIATIILLIVFTPKPQSPTDSNFEAWDQSVGEGNVSVGYKETSQYAYSYGTFELEMQEYMKEINVIRSKEEMDIFRRLVEDNPYEGSTAMKNILKEDKFSNEEYYQSKSIILCPIRCSSSVKDIRFTGLVKDSTGRIEVCISWFHPLQIDCDLWFKMIFIEVNQNIVKDTIRFDYLIYNTLDKTTMRVHSFC